MARRHRFILAVAAVAVATVDVVRTRQPVPPAPTLVDVALRKEVIDGAIEHMRNAYIFADVAEKMAEALRSRMAKNEYDGITAPREFAERVTKDLQSGT
jgi:hypothetical protein